MEGGGHTIEYTLKLMCADVSLESCPILQILVGFGWLLTHWNLNDSDTVSSGITPSAELDLEGV